MQSADDFRFTSHQLLLALDASTIQMMKMVALSSMGSSEWHAAVRLHHASYAALHLHLEHPDAAALMVRPSH
jgi:predicted transposase YdaD